MFAGVFDENYKLLGKERKKTKGHLGAEMGVERVIGTIREALAEAGVTAAEIAGIGVGCPGPLHLDEGVLIDAVNLGWKEVKLKKLLEAEFACPVTIANDVDAGVYGEYRFGAGAVHTVCSASFPVRASAEDSSIAGRSSAVARRAAWRSATCRCFPSGRAMAQAVWERLRRMRAGSRSRLPPRRLPIGVKRRIS